MFICYLLIFRVVSFLKHPLCMCVCVYICVCACIYICVCVYQYCTIFYTDVINTNKDYLKPVIHLIGLLKFWLPQQIWSTIFSSLQAKYDYFSWCHFHNRNGFIPWEGMYHWKKNCHLPQALFVLFSLLFIYFFLIFFCHRPSGFHRENSTRHFLILICKCFTIFFQKKNVLKLKLVRLPSIAQVTCDEISFEIYICCYRLKVFVFNCKISFNVTWNRI